MHACMSELLAPNIPFRRRALAGQVTLLGALAVRWVTLFEGTRCAAGVSRGGQALRTI